MNKDGGMDLPSVVDELYGLHPSGFTAARDSGEFTQDGECGSLQILRRVAPHGAAR